MQPTHQDFYTDLNSVQSVTDLSGSSTSASNNPSITYVTGGPLVPREYIEHRVEASRIEEDSQPLHDINLACAGFKDASEAETHLKSLTGLQRLSLRNLALDNQPLKGRLDLTALLGLTHLYLQNTSLREVDVSGLKHLQFVDVSGCKSLDLAFLAQLPDTCKVYLGGTWGMTTCADLKEHTDFFVKIAEGRVTAYSKGKGKREIDLTNFGLKRLPQSLRKLFEKIWKLTKVGFHPRLKASSGHWRSSAAIAI